ncbi:MAG TPA: hypothetical protein DEF89_23265 [Desulfosporosinus sp.]|nr:hypothetical protein [Desulfosporosinus sp.]
MKSILQSSGLKKGLTKVTIKQIDRNLCIECLQCVEICPMNVLFATENSGVEIRYELDCQSCYLCELACPSGAIVVLPWRAFELPDYYGIGGVDKFEDPK